MGTAIRFTRTADDGATETLTLCLLNGVEHVVQVTSGPDEGDDFVGIYDLDGDKWPTTQDDEWALCTSASAEIIAAIEDGWATGTNTVERIAE